MYVPVYYEYLVVVSSLDGSSAAGLRPSWIMYGRGRGKEVWRPKKLSARARCRLVPSVVVIVVSRFVVVMSSFPKSLIFYFLS